MVIIYWTCWVYVPRRHLPPKCRLHGDSKTPQVCLYLDHLFPNKCLISGWINELKMSCGNIHHTGRKLNLMLRSWPGSNAPEKIHRELILGALGTDTLESECEWGEKGAENRCEGVACVSLGSAPWAFPSRLDHHGHSWPFTIWIEVWRREVHEKYYSLSHRLSSSGGTVQWKQQFSEDATLLPVQQKAYIQPSRSSLVAF